MKPLRLQVITRVSMTNIITTITIETTRAVVPIAWLTESSPLKWGRARHQRRSNLKLNRKLVQITRVHPRYQPQAARIYNDRDPRQLHPRVVIYNSRLILETAPVTQLKSQLMKNERNIDKCSKRIPASPIFHDKLTRNDSE